VNVFALQDRITAEIAGALAIRVTEFEQRRVFAKPTESLEAYDLVLRSRPSFQRPTRANNVEARALLRRAIQLDPNYAAAYAALAETYHIAVSLGWAESPTVFLGRAAEMANKALTLNEAELRARIVLGRIHIFYHRYEQAKAEMDRVIAINPSDAHGLAGRGNILLWLGQTDAAVEALELAQRIDPELNAVDRFALSLAYYLKRRYDVAIEQAELAIRKAEGAHFSHVVLAAAYAQQDRAEDAARVAAMVRRIDPTFQPEAFGNKFLKAADLEHLRNGLRKAGLYGTASGPAPLSK
jgi:tetratricopeptide (TPR) repeat protein